jgi:hypothetical protein
MAVLRIDPLAFSTTGLLAAGALLLSCGMVRAEVTLQTEYTRLVLDDRGWAQSFVDRTSGQELLAETGEQPFMAVRLGGAELPASAASLDGDRLQVTFGEDGARAEFLVKQHPRYVSFELVSVTPEDVEEVRLADLLLKPMADASSAANICYDDRFAVSVMALSLPVACQLRRYSPSSGTLEGVTQSFRPGTGEAPVGNGYGEYTATNTRETPDGWSVRHKRLTTPLDLSGFAGLGLWVRGDGKGELLKVQLYDGKGSGMAHFKDHYTRIDFEGWRYVELPHVAEDEVDYSHIVNVNLYYNGIPAQTTVSCGIDDLRALKTLTGEPSTSEDDLVLEDFEGPDCEYYDREGVALTATCLAKYGTVGSRVALFGCPRPALSTVIAGIERNEGLPCPQLSGKWGRESPDVKRSYLMLHDLSEGNVDRAIEYARLANVGMIVFCEPCWATSAGHFPIKESNFPNGLEGLKRTVEKVHKAGFRSGLHFLAAGIGSNDPYITPVPDPRLLKDAEATLAEDIDKKATTVLTTDVPEPNFPRENGSYNGNGVDIQIDQEIIHYGAVEDRGFVQCQRGAYETTPAPHKQGAPIHHLRRHYGMFLRDADSTMNDEVADRIAHIVNTCGFGMAYFDGSERLQDDHWYYNPKIQYAYWKRFENRDRMLLQGSSYSHFSWHMHARQASADGYRDIKQLLDERSPRFEAGYRKNFMPLDIGWYGIGQQRLTADDAEYVCCRSIGFDASIGWSTSVAALDGNPRSRELLEMAGRYERLRLAGAFDEATKARLREPGQDFRLVGDGDDWRFVPVEYDAPVTVAATDGTQNVWPVTNTGGNPAQPVEIEVSAGPLAQPGANWDRDDNLVLESFETLAPYAESPQNEYEKYVIGPGKHGAVKEGVTQRFELTTEVTRTGAATGMYQATSALHDNSGWSAVGKRFEPALDISWMQGIGLWVHGDGKGAAFKVQLRDDKGGWNDHYIRMDYEGWRYHELVKPQAGELDRSHVEYLIFYFNGLPGDETSTVYIDTVKALRELTSPLSDISIAVGNAELRLPVTLGENQSLLFRAMDDCTLYEWGKEPTPIEPTGAPPVLTQGENEMRVGVAGELTHSLIVRVAKVYE